MTIKKMYRLHRIASTLIGIPIFLWAISGLMHPLMTNVRPEIQTQERPAHQLPAAVLQKAVPLKTLLKQQRLRQSFKIRLINMDSHWYYQVSEAPQSIPRYFNLHSGQELKDGDQRYAILLARHFLEGDRPPGNTPVVSVERITDFTDQYSYVNRLLPVYKIAFKRTDQITVFVDTHNSEFAFALDHHRAAFNRFFGWFHTWSWMDGLPRLKAGIIALILLMALATGSLGIYLAVKTKSGSSKKNNHPLIKARRLHRSTAVIGAVFLLAWAFSGLIHALQNGRAPFYITPVSLEMTQTSSLPDSLGPVMTALARKTALGSIGLKTLDGKLWLETVSFERQTGARDLMKSQGVPARPGNYYTWENSPAPNPVMVLHDSSPRIQKYSEKQMVERMAALVLQKSGTVHTTPAMATDSSKMQLQYLTHFTEQYNFSDKILPVWQISYGDKVSDRLFIDATTGSLVKKGDTFKQADALIFAFFHKHEFMSWAGKTAKDASTVLGILILITLLIVGYRLLYIRCAD